MKEKEYYSDCCGAFMGAYYEDTGICPACNDHCDPQEQALECPFCQHKDAYISKYKPNVLHCMNCRKEYELLKGEEERL